MSIIRLDPKVWRGQPRPKSGLFSLSLCALVCARRGQRKLCVSRCASLCAPSGNSERCAFLDLLFSPCYDHFLQFSFSLFSRGPHLGRRHLVGRSRLSVPIAAISPLSSECRSQRSTCLSLCLTICTILWQAFAFVLTFTQCIPSSQCSPSTGPSWSTFTAHTNTHLQA